MIHSRSILIKHKFSPLNDLEKSNDTGILRLADKRRLGRPELVARIEALEHDIVNYFKSRNEDKETKTPAQRPTPTKTQPSVPVKTQGHRVGGSGGGFRPSPMHRPQIWSSGSSGTHVDYEDNQNHHHHPHDDQHHHHHHHDQHHHDNDQHHHHHDQHHHDNDQNHHHCPPDNHSSGHHDDFSHVDNSGYNHDYSSSGAGYDNNTGGGCDNTNYGGPGSFY